MTIARSLRRMFRHCLAKDAEVRSLEVNPQLAVDTLVLEF
jgi:hypothetical protein